METVPAVLISLMDSKIPALQTRVVGFILSTKWQDGAHNAYLGLDFHWNSEKKRMETMAGIEVPISPPRISESAGV